MVIAQNWMTQNFWMKWVWENGQAGDTSPNALQIYIRGAGSPVGIGCYANYYNTTWTKFTLTFTPDDTVSILYIFGEVRLRSDR